MSNCTETFTLANGDTVSCNRKAAPKKSVLGHENVCFPCFEAWMMENDHNDNGHDEAVANCPECGTYDPRTKQGHTKTKGTKQVHRSHANCNHDKTPAARAKCRKARNKANDALDAIVAPVVNPYAERFDAITDKQRDAVWDRLTAYDVDLSDDDRPRVYVEVLEAARKGKCSVAKLTDAKITAIINA